MVMMRNEGYRKNAMSMQMFTQKLVLSPDVSIHGPFFAASESKASLISIHEMT